MSHRLFVMILRVFIINENVATRPVRLSTVLAVLLLATQLSGCSAIIGNAMSGMAEMLTTAILNNPDIETVQTGLPSYLLMADALVASAPDNAEVALSAAQLYSAYASGFVDDAERANRLATKALHYALSAFCRQDQAPACDLRKMPYEAFTLWVANQKPKNLDAVYRLAAVWAGWVQANASDYNAIAELARVKLLMGWVLAQDETVDYGGPHLYFGVFETLLPAAYGGRPEVGRRHFERAIEISEGRYLMAKVFFARQYARLLYNRALHDQLLQEVVAADPVAEGITIVNVLAQQQAKQMLSEADDYF